MNKPVPPNRSRRIALVIAFAIGLQILFILGIAYLAWDILSMYFRMKSLG